MSFHNKISHFANLVFSSRLLFAIGFSRKAQFRVLTVTAIKAALKTKETGQMQGLINRLGLTWERWYGMHTLKINFGFNCMQYHARVYVDVLEAVLNGGQFDVQYVCIEHHVLNVGELTIAVVDKFQRDTFFVFDPQNSGSVPQIVFVELGAHCQLGHIADRVQLIGAQSYATVARLLKLLEFLVELGKFGI
ncbi:hypothetical protein BpHYR1_039597 [Brachionus plicatilis]|uniref:Uncharacterized protein n=1 Tax=Brachionus plicatilis TaxID=10195 RepID=A0A3M7QNW4_BRAPC|nr:hypothetical protein BpHYR1_039597 [Brachionus plicatilis]